MKAEVELGHHRRPVAIYDPAAVRDGASELVSADGTAARLESLYELALAGHAFIYHPHLLRNQVVRVVSDVDEDEAACDIPFPLVSGGSGHLLRVPSGRLAARVLADDEPERTLCGLDPGAYELTLAEVDASGLPMHRLVAEKFGPGVDRIMRLAAGIIDVSLAAMFIAMLMLIVFALTGGDFAYPITTVAICLGILAVGPLIIWFASRRKTVRKVDEWADSIHRAVPKLVIHFKPIPEWRARGLEGTVYRPQWDEEGDQWD